MIHFSFNSVRAIYTFELARFGRTILTSLATPVITTSLYFIVFGSAIGSQMKEIDGIPYGAFIVPGLIMLSMFTESIFNSSFGIYMPKYTSCCLRPYRRWKRSSRMSGRPRPNP